MAVATLCHHFLFPCAPQTSLTRSSASLPLQRISLPTNWLPLPPNPRSKPRPSTARAGRNGPDLSNFDEDGVVRDMELYLNDLSLEYDSVWDTKPAWCQPWSIVLTGFVAVGVSWLSLHSVFMTGLVTAIIAFWWFVFLYSYPQAYSEMIAERREKVKAGDEDTFGTQRPVK